MIEADNESLRNSCNAPKGDTASTHIKEFFMKYPQSNAKECCRVLILDYGKYGGRARKIKHDIKHWMQSIVSVTNQYGRGLKPHACVHRVEYRFREPVPPGFIMVFEKVSLGRVKGVWYRSSNRNKQLEYFDDDVSVRVYPKSGTCRIFPRKAMSFEDLRVKVENMFAKALPARVLLSDDFGQMMRGLQVKSRHRAFNVGPITPFRVGFYGGSLGLDILADGSHPNHLEVHESWPTWISPLLEFQRNQRLALESNTKILSDFTSQIRSHLDALRGIALAGDQLKEAICNLNRLIDRHLSSNNGD